MSQGAWLAGSELIGYADTLSTGPGESVRFMVSTSEPDYDVQVVRLLHGDENPEGPGFKEELIDSAANGRYPGRRQVVRPGSYLEVVDQEPFQLASFTLQAWIAPTRPVAGRRQAIMSCWESERGLGYGLFLDEDGHLALMLGTDSGVSILRAARPVRDRGWSFVAATFDSESGEASLSQAPLSPWATQDDRAIASALLEHGAHWPPVLDARFRIGAASAGAGDTGVASAYDGKIDSPAVFSRALRPDELERLATAAAAGESAEASLVARWNLAADQSAVSVPDEGPSALHAVAVNMPTRAVTGRTWSGRETDFRLVPDEYAAIHFHADDIEDAGWEVDFEWAVPAGLRSGVYAARLRAGELVDHIPFVVRPERFDASTRVLVVLPTMTYLAYANERVGDSYQTNTPPGWQAVYDPLDRYVAEHPEFGKSLYDVHDDLSGVCYSSALRPIPNLRPRYRHRNVNAPRHLAGDLYLIDWLEEKGFAYDVVADGDLHADGVDVLEHYRVVITGGHPEYWSTEMLAAIENWVYEKGGRVMYLGGNGLYWVTSVHPERPHVIEVRRGIAGSRPWESQPGELHHSTTGEPGGLWRYRGKLPNRLYGVAYAAEGGGESSGYTRTAASFGEAVSFVFEGVDTDGAIGRYGLVGGGAAGDEVDRADFHLGTPADAVVLASSEVLRHYGVALEDAREFRGGRRPGEARADMVLLQAPRGGAVFSVGSISWSGALSHNRYDNDVSRITANVLRRFAGLDGSEEATPSSGA